MSIFRKAMRDMLCDRAGRVVYEKVAACTAHLFSSAWVSHAAWNGALTTDLFVAYMSFACGHATFSKYLSVKHQPAKEPSNEQ